MTGTLLLQSALLVRTVLRPLLLLLVTRHVTAATPYSFELTGSCAWNSDINDLYAPVNKTSDGRWYFKGQNGGLYIYFDSDCDGTSGASVSDIPDMWVIDSDEPSRTASSDLDGDGDCSNSGDGYKARYLSTEMEPPIGTHTWSVWCLNAARDVDLTTVLIEAPTFSPTVTQHPTVSVPPTLAPTLETCFDTCYGQSCDGWTDNGWTCLYLETIVGCDCAGCNCVGETPGPSPIPTVTSPPSITASPTTTQDVANFVQLQAAVNSAIAWIHVVTMSITIASTLVIDGYDMRISGTSPIDGSATLDGGGSVQIFQVVNGGRLVLEHVALTNGYVIDQLEYGGGAALVQGLGSELVLDSCTMSSNTAGVSRPCGNVLEFVSCRFLTQSIAFKCGSWAALILGVRRL